MWFFKQLFVFHSIFPLAAAIGGGASLLGNFISGLFGASAQDSANQTNLQLASENRDFVAKMSNTAHQREVNDLRAAGLNPLLSAGSGASTPSTSAAEVAASNPASGLGTGVSDGVNTAMSAMALKGDLEKKSSETALNTAATATEAAKTLATANSAKESKARTEALESQMPATKAKAKFESSEYSDKLENAAWDRTIRRATDALGVGTSAMDLVNPLKGLLKGQPKGWSGKSKDLFDYMNRRPRP